MIHTIKTFLKFGSLKHITDLYENGTIFINTVEYFRRHQDGNIRGDSYEGASKISNFPPGKVRISGLEGEFDYLNFHLKEAHESILGNIYCLYCISSHGIPDPHKFKIDKRNAEFGSHCLMIQDNQYFFEKIKSELSDKGFKFRYGFVDYYNKKIINRELTIFEKPDEYEYQKEFRFYVRNNKIEPIKIQIGSLKEYSEIFETEYIIKGLQLV